MINASMVFNFQAKMGYCLAHLVKFVFSHTCQQNIILSFEEFIEINKRTL
jgi:hypothetical protein